MFEDIWIGVAHDPPTNGVRKPNFTEGDDRFKRPKPRGARTWFERSDAPIITSLSALHGVCETTYGHRNRTTEIENELPISRAREIASDLFAPTYLPRRIRRIYYKYGGVVW